MTDVKKWLAGILCTIVAGAFLLQADARWLRVASFQDWQTAQVVRDNQAELRRTERQILDVEGDLKYGATTSERKAQLEVLLELLEQQRDELKRAISEGMK